MSERAAPQYCPYCAEEDLCPEPSGHRAWHCRGCARVFELAFVGLKLRADEPPAPVAPEQDSRASEKVTA